VIDCIETPSPNFDERKLPVSMIVLHYTGMPDMQLALERFGYDVTDTQKAVIAFQRLFRPDIIDGIIDGECRAKLLALLLPRPQ
jgi:N-acetyl-anhydromuramyl-L-alanine amidase AmpD